jgi:hypothetical protein
MVICVSLILSVGDSILALVTRAKIVTLPSDHSRSHKFELIHTTFVIYIYGQLYN